MRHPSHDDLTLLRKLQTLTFVPELTAEDRQAAVALLDDAIVNERFASDLVSLTVDTDQEDQSRDFAARDLLRVTPSRHRRTWFVPTVLAVAAVFVLAVSFAAVLWVIDSEPVTAIESIAQVVETLPQDQFGDATLVRSVAEERLTGISSPDAEVMFIDAVTATERFDASGLVERTEVHGEPRLLNPDDSPFLDLIRDDVSVGESKTVVYSFLDSEEALFLTESPDALGRVMRSQYERWANPEIPFQAYALDRITSMYITTFPTPPERAAMLTFIGSIEGLTQVASDNGVSVSYAYLGDQGAERRQLDFDSDGWLTGVTLTFVDGIAIAGVPPGTESTIRMTPPEVLDD